MNSIANTFAKARWGRAVFLTYPDRIVRVSTLADADHQLGNGWPHPSDGSICLAHIIACNAVNLASRGVFNAEKARKLFVEAARAAGIN